MSSGLSLIYYVSVFCFSQIGRKICLIFKLSLQKCLSINISWKYFIVLIQKLYNCFQWNLEITNTTIHLVEEAFLPVLNLGKKLFNNI